MELHLHDPLPPERNVCSRLHLSKWINEPCPAWTTLLTAHEVARLTRRPRCLLPALALFGRFPAPTRYRGKTLGWQPSDIEAWLEMKHTSAADARRTSRCLGRVARKKTFCRTRWSARRVRHGH